jgi:hypothetical protein
MDSTRSSITKYESPSRLSFENRARDLIITHRRLFILTDVLDFQWCQNVLTVRGVVPTFYLKQLLQIALMELGNDVKIENRVEVSPTTPPMPSVF